MLAKKTLKLSEQGFELMDKKRLVLIREIMELNDRALEVQSRIEKTFSDAYAALIDANIEMGKVNAAGISEGITAENGINIRFRSVMGVELPIVLYESREKETPDFSFGNTSITLDYAIKKFELVKSLLMELATLENSVYRLAINIKKTQKRANALKNVTIPRYSALARLIEETLEERERDEFARLKVVKKKKIR
jgi:V/A-type H+-transporting ATPase subunit D